MDATRGIIGSAIETGAGRRMALRGMALALATLMVCSAAWAQKKQKNPPLNTTPMPQLQLPIPDQIDHDIGEMLGAFQVGNLEAMHKYYAENATWVSGAYAPPIAGWPAYVAAYQQERAAFPEGFQLIRRNTNIFHSGDVAWASYQWELDSSYSGKPYEARGQTTLVLVKQGNDWLIVHNHTSQICPNEASRPAVH
jgi:ketosteroid isomerase-like protein